MIGSGSLRDPWPGPGTDRHSWIRPRGKSLFPTRKRGVREGEGSMSTQVCGGVV